MKVLVTGCTGVTGIQVVEDLLNKGHTVTGVIRDKNASIPKTPHFKAIYGDLLNPLIVGMALKDQDAIIHLAHDVGHGNEWTKNKYNTEQHKASIEIINNILSVIEPYTRLIFTSSVSVYGGHIEDCMLTENSDLKSSSTYAEAKILIETSIRQFHRNHVIFRPTRIAAPWGKNVLSNLAKAVKYGQEFTIMNSGKTTLDTIHVRDASNALIQAAEGTGNGTYNLSNADGMSLMEMFQYMKSLTDNHGKLITVLPDNPSNEPVYAVHDNTKLLRDFNIHPQSTMENLFSLMA